MTDLRQPAYESLDSGTKALVDTWVAELGREPAGAARILAADEAVPCTRGRPAAGASPHERPRKTRRAVLHQSLV